MYYKKYVIEGDEPVEAEDAVGPEVEARVLAAPAPLAVPSVVGVVLGVGVTVRVKLVFGVVKVVISRKVVKLLLTKEMSWWSSSLSLHKSMPFYSF